MRRGLRRAEEWWFRWHAVAMILSGTAFTFGLVVAGVTWWVGYMVPAALYVGIVLVAVTLLVEVLVRCWVEIDEERREDEERLAHEAEVQQEAEQKRLRDDREDQWPWKAEEPEPQPTGAMSQD